MSIIYINKCYQCPERGPALFGMPNIYCKLLKKNVDLEKMDSDCPVLKNPVKIKIEPRKMFKWRN